MLPHSILLFTALCYLSIRHNIISHFFFFNDTATTEIYTLSLHDALPISQPPVGHDVPRGALVVPRRGSKHGVHDPTASYRSEEHTSELQSLAYLVCRLLLEKKKKKQQSKRGLL